MTRLFRLGVIKKIPRIIASGWRRECEIQGLLLDAGKSRRALTKQLQYILVFLVGSSAKTQERVSGTAVSGGGSFLERSARIHQRRKSKGSDL